MYKLKLLLLPVAWLLAFMAFACAPPDDDAPSSGPSGPSGPTINNAIYDFATALLTIQGTKLSPTEAQIQTITVAGLAFSSYTADDDATGLNSNGLEQGKYRIKSDGTALWLKLTDRHKAVLEAKVGSNGLKKGLLSVGSGAWAGLDTAKDLDVSNVPENKQSKVSDDNQPSKQTEEAEQVEEESPEAAITGASYHVGTALLTLQGSNLSATTATQAQIQTIRVGSRTNGVALSSYTADTTATGPDSRSLAKGKYRIKSDGTVLWLYLTDTDKAILQGKPGMDSNGLKDGLLSVGTGTWAGLNTAKALAVSGNPPAITRATYNIVTDVLVITGVNLPKAVTGWDFSKLRLVSGDGSESYTLPRHAIGENTATGSAASATSLTILLKGSEKDKADAILVKNGDSDDNGAYNLEAAAGFAGGRAEDTSNPIIVSGYVGFIKDLHYYVNTGVLYINGGGLPKAVADWDFSKLTLVSGDGKKKYTLPRHAIGENTATGSSASAIDLSITLSGSVKAEAEKILVKDGKSDNAGAYNLEAAAGFAGYSAADTSNPITVSGYVSQLNYSNYFASSGQLYIYGSRLPTAVADWDFSKLTIVSGDGKKKYQLPKHSTLGSNKATGSSASTIIVLITLSGSVKAEAEKILVKAGVRDNDGVYNLEAAAGFEGGSAEDLTTSINVIR